MRWQLVIAMLAASSFSHGVRAQESKCEALLRDGVRDYQGQSVDYFRYEKVKTWLSRNQFTSYEEAKKSAQNLDAGVEDIFSLKFGTSESRTNFQQWRDDFIASDFSQVSEQQNTRNVLQKVSEALVNAFEKCVNKRYGTSIWVDASSDTDFAIFYRFTPPSDFASSKVNVTGFTVTHARCEPPLTRIKAVGPISSVQCRKDKPQDIAAVLLATDQFGPQVQPRFAPVIVPAAAPRYTISGEIGATATRVSQHTLTFSFSARPTDAELAGARQGQPFTWRTTIERDIDEYDFVSNPQISPTTLGGFQECSMIGSGAEKKATKVSVFVDAKCIIVANFANWRFDPTTSDYLKQGRFVFSANINLEQRLPVNADTKPIFESNSLSSSWSFPFDNKRESTLVWNYFFDINITSSNGHTPYHIYRTKDGKKQQLTAGPFRATFGDDQTLTIFRYSGLASQLKAASVATQ